MNQPLPQTLEKAGGQRGSALGGGPLLRGKKGAPSGVVLRDPGLHGASIPAQSAARICPQMRDPSAALLMDTWPCFVSCCFCRWNRPGSTPAGRVHEPILVDREMIGHGTRPSVTWAPPPRVNVHVNFMAASRLPKRAPQTWHFSLPCVDFSCAPK